MEQLGGVFPEARAASPDESRRLAQVVGRLCVLDRAEVGLVELHHHPPRAECRIAGDVLTVLHRTGGDAALLQQQRDRVRRSHGRPLAEGELELRPQSRLARRRA